MLSPVDGLWKIVTFLGENGRECYRPGEPKNKDRTTGGRWRGKGEEMGGIGRNLVTKVLACYFVLLAMRHAFEGFNQQNVRNLVGFGKMALLCSR